MTDRTGTNTTASVVCLQCKLLDSRSAFTYTHSYCKKDDTCLMDQWNYVNAWCPSKWIPGWMLDVDEDCSATDHQDQCLPILAEENQITIQEDYNLPNGGQCTIAIDATKGMARVRFNKAAQLGVLFTGYKDGEPITIPKGEVQSITVYNGDIRFPLAFEVTVSGAAYLSSMVALGSTFLASTLY